MNETFYLTRKGLERIQKEYQILMDFKASKMKGEVPTMLRSEDVEPEYLVYQEDLSLLEARLAEYDAIIKNAKIIEIPPKDQRHIIFLGATVTLVEKTTGVINEYTLLGTLEANPIEGKISVESPVGKELFGKKIDDMVVISSPIRVVYTVKKIIY